MTNKKLAYMAIPALAAIMFGMGFASNQALAAPALVVMDPDGCAVIDGAGNVVGVPDGKNVITNNGKGKSMIKCFGTGLGNIPDKAVKWNFDNTGFSCTNLITNQVTLDWQNIADTEGNAVLTCKFSN